MPRVVNLSNLTQFAAVNLSDGGYLPGPRIIPNACQVMLNWSLTDGKTGHNVLYATYNGTPALAPSVAEAIRTGIVSDARWTTLAGFLATTASLTSVQVLDVRSSTGTAFQSTGAAAPGTSASTALPDEMAAVITLRTATRGPSGRGRVYIPGWATNAEGAGGVIVATAVTALAAFAVLLSSTINTVIGPWVIALPARQSYTSPTTGRQFPARAATTRLVTAAPVRDNHWDSQRRRGLK